MAKRSKVVRIKGQGLADWRKKVMAHGVGVATDIAKEAVPEINARLWSDYDSGRTCYGNPRPRGVYGNDLSLIDSGDTRRSLSFDNQGTVLRVKLNYPHVKYLIGKYKILPCGPTTAIPVQWRRILELITDRVLSRQEKAA